MFGTFLKFELSRGLRQPMVYIFMGILGLLVFGAVVSENVVIGGAVGNINRNAPHVVAVYSAVLSIFGLLFAAAFFNNAALRDYNYQFEEILFSKPLSKSGYFFGRFMGAWILSVIPFLGIYLGFFLGTLIGPLAGWMPAARMGSIPYGAFLSTWLLFGVSNMFIAGSLIFGLATRFKSTIVSFTGALLVIVAYFITQSLLRDLESEQVGAFVDFFGIGTYSLDSKYYSPFEKNTLIPGFGGYLFLNRLVWIAVGGIVLTLFYLTFSIRTKSRKVTVRRVSVQSKPERKSLIQPEILASTRQPSFWNQFSTFFQLNFSILTRSQVFHILLVFNLVLLVSNLWGGFEYYGLKSYPVTYKMMDVIGGNAGLFLLIIMVFFSGELVWRDRDVHINEVIDATPHWSFTSLFAKALSLVVLLVVFYLFSIGIAILYQFINGFFDVKLGVYITDFFVNTLPSLVTIAFLLIFIQVAVNHKYLGYFISILLLFAVDILMLIAGVESKMLAIGDAPRLIFSDMSGFGPGQAGAFWFSLYWLLFGIAMLYLAGLLWPRGTVTGFYKRLKNAGRGIVGSHKVAFLSICAGWLVVAGWVYYNTQLLNPYLTTEEQELQQVAYEKRYAVFKDKQQPQITASKYYIDVYPGQRKFQFKVDVSLKNTGKLPIDSLHFVVDRDWNHEIDVPGGKEIFRDTEIGYVILGLESPLDTGEMLELVVRGHYAVKGFENGTGNTGVLSNGTFLNNFQFMPSFGYSEKFELTGKDKRKKYGLPFKRPMPLLEDPCGASCQHNYLTGNGAVWVDVETIISTSSDQIAIAPGSLIREWEEKDRRHFHYKLDHPSQNFYSFISADFEVARRRWNEVDIEVYYDAQHSYNVEKMLDAVERSLDYYSTHFGPYYHKQARIIEFPRYGTFAQAFPGTMPYSESIGFIINLEDKEEHSIVDAVIAHEMAHQWWAHQEISANMQGATFLTESLSEYSSLMVMKQESDDIKMREFLKYNMDRYLSGRSRETEREVPLYKVENQDYIHYGKGSLVLYALQDYIGEESVNAALRSFLEEYRYSEPPYPTSMDLIRHLETSTPDSMRYLLDDWIKEITLYDFRMKKADLVVEADSTYRIMVAFESEKIKADSIGTENRFPMNDWVDIGFFEDVAADSLFHIERVKMQGTYNKMTFTLKKRPAKVIIDPRKLLIERIDDDNGMVVELE